MSGITRQVGARRRHGFTLVEMLVYFALASVVLRLAVGLVQRAGGENRRATDELGAASTLHRLASDLRADVHRATKTEVAMPNQLWLNLDDGRLVKYSQDGNRLVRWAWTADTQTVENYRFPRDELDVIFSVDDRLVSLSIGRADGTTSLIPRESRILIEAALLAANDDAAAAIEADAIEDSDVEKVEESR